MPARETPGPSDRRSDVADAMLRMYAHDPSTSARRPPRRRTFLSRLLRRLRQIAP